MVPVKEDVEGLAGAYGDEEVDRSYDGGQTGQMDGEEEVVDG